MADTDTTEATAEDEVLENDADRWLGWTVQETDDDGNFTVPPETPRELPQLFHPDQMPEGENAPEHLDRYMTDDWSLIDPPGGIALNRETTKPHIEELPFAGVQAPTPAVDEEGDNTNLNGMTKAELQNWAESRGIEGVDQDSQTKAEMIAAIEAAG